MSMRLERLEPYYQRVWKLNPYYKEKSPELPRAEQERQEERRIQRELRVTLHGRLLLRGAAVDPGLPVPKIHPDLLEKYTPGFSETQALSELERQEAGFTMDQWVNGTVVAFQERRNFFLSSRGQVWVGAYSRLGIKNIYGFKEDDAKALHKKFFSDERKGQEVKMMAEDILKSYGDKLNIDDVERDLKAYEWLGNMFGKTSSVILIEQIYLLALAKSEDQKKKKELIRQVNRNNRINNPLDQERQLLHAVWSAKYVGELVMPEFIGANIRPVIVDVAPALLQEDETEGNEENGVSVSGTVLLEPPKVSAMIWRLGSLALDLDRKLQNNRVKRSRIFPSLLPKVNKKSRPQP